MDPELDLTTASRETLLAIIAELRATVAQLQQRVATLEARLNSRGSPGMPGTKPASSRSAPRKPAQKRRPHGFARVRMAPTQRVEHAVEVCPDCGTHLSGGWVQRTREVIEIPVVPVQVTEHVIIARVCPICERRRVPKTQWDGVVAGQQRFGVNLVLRRKDGDPPGRGTAAPTDDSVVSANGAPVASECGGHRPGHPPGGPKCPTCGAPDPATYPRQSSGARR